MSPWRQALAQPWALWLLALLPALAVAAWRARRRRRAALARFGRPTALAPLLVTEGRRRAARAVCLLLGLGWLIVGVAGPQWGRAWGEAAFEGRDLVLVVDVSRSMLARDVLPDRLERAKQASLDLTRVIQERGGHRLALVAFAGRARVVCPLTRDFDHVRAAIQDLDARHPHPALRPAQGAASGTRIGLGLRAAVEAHDPRFEGRQDVLLLSDGDDPARDGEWRQGVKAARARRVPVHAVGLGDPARDGPIPVREDAPLHYQEKVVQTRLVESVLEEIARQTRGTYTPARTQAFALGELFRTRIEPGLAREARDDELPVPRQRYPWFLGAALVFLALEMVLHRGLFVGRQAGRWGPRRTALLPLVALTPLAAEAVSALRSGNVAFSRGDYGAAVAHYERAEGHATDPGHVALNKAAALYRLGRYAEAEQHYRRAGEGAEAGRRAHARYGQGNCLLHLGQWEPAASCYEECLRREVANPELMERARYNLELAKLLLQRAPARDPKAEPPEPDKGPSPPAPDRQAGGDATHRDPPGGAGNPDPAEPKAPNRPGPESGARSTAEAPPPGKGNLPPIPDEDDAAPLSAAEAARYLEQETARIARERREHRRTGNLTPGRTTPDW